MSSRSGLDNPPMRWDVFCRVVDNWGDIGFGWRLAVDLAARGEAVRFWVDDPSVLAWMAPGGADPAVELRRWHEAVDARVCGDVVVETFGGGLPGAFAPLMRRRHRSPVWINVEHLSAEGYVERNHGLSSPRIDGPFAGLSSWFFYPGFSSGTGGLLREHDLEAQQRGFSPADGLRRSTGREAGDTGKACDVDAPLTVSLFCYEAPALPALLRALAPTPTRLLVTPGHAAEAMSRALGDGAPPRGQQVHRLPALSQREFDHLLWSCDLNFVRGEDSFVRAQWAGIPFVWQPYVQADGAHWMKLDAFLARFLAAAPAPLAADIHRLHATWNAVPGAAVEMVLPELAAWKAHCARWRDRLLALPDFSAALRTFAAARAI